MVRKTLTIRYQTISVDLPYYELTGKRPGDMHLFISGGMHGNEINGIATIKEFLRWATETHLEDHLAGRLTIVPILNPSGFNAGKRNVPEDHRDLNRQFGVDMPMSISEQIAHDVTYALFKHCNMGIDVHDSGGNVVLIPHCRIHKSDELNCISCTRSMAQTFGTQLVLERDGDPGMLAVSMFSKFKIPVITVELGGAQRLFPRFIKQGLQGIQNVLIALHMIAREPKMPAKQYVLSGRYGVRINRPAMVEFSAKLGEEVTAGQTIGELYFPQEQVTEPLTAPMGGFIFSRWYSNQITPWKTLYSILNDQDLEVTGRTMQTQFAELPHFVINQIEL